MKNIKLKTQIVKAQLRIPNSISLSIELFFLLSQTFKIIRLHVSYFLFTLNRAGNKIEFQELQRFAREP